MMHSILNNQTFSNIAQLVTEHVAIHHGSIVTRVAAIFLGVIVTEATLSLIGNGIDSWRRPSATLLKTTYELVRSPQEQLNYEEVKNRNYDISANLGSALFYGMCALNIIPGSAKAAAAIFTVYSLYKYTAVKEEMEGHQNHNISVRRPIYYTSEIIGRIGHRAYNILRNFEFHPIWLGVAFMGIAIPVYLKVKG